MDIWLKMYKSLCQKYTIVNIIYRNKKEIDGYNTITDSGLFLDDEKDFVKTFQYISSLLLYIDSE
jgi:hypothetical protein